LIVVVFGHETDGNSRDHIFHRHAGVHEGEHSAAHARHRSRAVRFHYFAGNTNGITKVIFTRDHRLKRTFRQCAVADLAAARAAKPSGFAD
jgi:hypothetical protein